MHKLKTFFLAALLALMPALAMATADPARNPPELPAGSSFPYGQLFGPCNYDASTVSGLSGKVSLTWSVTNGCGVNSIFVGNPYAISSSYLDGMAYWPVVMDNAYVGKDSGTKRDTPWWQTHYPNQLLYKCDGRSLAYFSSKFFTVGVTNNSTTVTLASGYDSDLGYFEAGALVAGVGLPDGVTIYSVTPGSGTSATFVLTSPYVGSATSVKLSFGGSTMHPPLTFHTSWTYGYIRGTTANQTGLKDQLNAGAAGIGLDVVNPNNTVEACGNYPNALPGHGSWPNYGDFTSYGGAGPTNGGTYTAGDGQYDEGSGCTANSGTGVFCLFRQYYPRGWNNNWDLSNHDEYAQDIKSTINAHVSWGHTNYPSAFVWINLQCTGYYLAAPDSDLSTLCVQTKSQADGYITEGKFENCKNFNVATGKTCDYTFDLAFDTIFDIIRTPANKTGWWDIAYLPCMVSTGSNSCATLGFKGAATYAVATFLLMRQDPATEPASYLSLVGAFGLTDGNGQTDHVNYHAYDAHLTPDGIGTPSANPVKPVKGTSACYSRAYSGGAVYVNPWSDAYRNDVTPAPSPPLASCSYTVTAGYDQWCQTVTAGTKTLAQPTVSGTRASAANAAIWMPNKPSYCP